MIVVMQVLNCITLKSEHQSTSFSSSGRGLVEANVQPHTVQDTNLGEVARGPELQTELPLVLAGFSLFRLFFFFFESQTSALICFSHLAES